jgi:hypothetical protein
MNILRNPWMAWLLASPLLASEPPACLAPEPRNIAVLIGNYASVPNPVLTEAQAEAERILTPVGLDIEWRQSRPTSPENDKSPSPAAALLAIQLLSPAMEARLRRPPKGEVGLAFGSTAYIFCRRLDQVAQRVLPDSRSRLLGNVLAHEIAHLLLGPGAHASGGIMQPHWGTAELLRLEQGGLTLLPPQIDRLRCAAP